MFKRKGYEASQLRVAETCPPCDEIGIGSGMPLLDCCLAQVSFRQRRIWSNVVGTDGAAHRKAGTDEHGKGALGWHGLLPERGMMSRRFVTIIHIGHLLSTFKAGSKL
ncbi:hypothetical protein D3C84_993350 [compost metagenome]